VAGRNLLRRCRQGLHSGGALPDLRNRIFSAAKLVQPLVEHAHELLQPCVVDDLATAKGVTTEEAELALMQERAKKVGAGCELAGGLWNGYFAPVIDSSWGHNRRPRFRPGVSSVYLRPNALLLVSSRASRQPSTAPPFDRGNRCGGRAGHA